MKELNKSEIIEVLLRLKDDMKYKLNLFGTRVEIDNKDGLHFIFENKQEIILDGSENIPNAINFENIITGATMYEGEINVMLDNTYELTTESNWFKLRTKVLTLQIIEDRSVFFVDNN